VGFWYGKGADVEYVRISSLLEPLPCSTDVEITSPFITHNIPTSNNESTWSSEKFGILIAIATSVYTHAGDRTLSQRATTSYKTKRDGNAIKLFIRVKIIFQHPILPLSLNQNGLLLIHLRAKTNNPCSKQQNQCIHVFKRSTTNYPQCQRFFRATTTAARSHSQSSAKTTRTGDAWYMHTLLYVW
jgi:hypothetical protein